MTPALKRNTKLSGSALPRGFRFAAMACGLKKNGRPDLAVLSSDAPAAAAGVFTTNLVQAAPVVLSREHLRRSARAVRAIVVNSGNANCATGPVGMAAAQTTATAAARALDCRPEQVLVCSTGVIGVPLRVERILRAISSLVRTRRATPGAFAAVTRAIMTTDTRPKWAAVSCRIGGRRVRLLGCAKGAGMIHPQMATMLAFVLTDAAAPPVALRRALGEVTARTFNAITIDGDTSTNDTLLLLASGASGAPAITTHTASYREFAAALEKICRALALALVADGEGAKRVVEIEVRGARSGRAAKQVARTIAGSPLVKTALAGADPNWGRILAAAGRAGVPFDPDRAEIWMAGMKVYSRGRALPFNERTAHRKLLSDFIPIVMDLRQARTGARITNHKSRVTRHKPRLSGAARIWTCDFTADYVRINASYRT